jgi:hypothetical protein
VAVDYESLIDGEASAPASPGEQKSKYDQILDEEQGQQADTLRQSMYVGSQKNPDQYAKVLGLSSETQIPPSIAERNFDQIQKKRTLKETNYDSLVNNTPGLARWLESPDNVAVAHDDLPALQGIEQTFKDHKSQSDLAKWFDLGLTQLESSLAKTPGFLADAAVQPANWKARLFNVIAEATGSPARREFTRAPDVLYNNPITESLDARAKDIQERSPELSADILGEVGKGNYRAAGKALAAQLVANAPNQALLIGLAMRGMPTLGLGVAGVTTATQAQSENRANPDVPIDVGMLDATAKGLIEASFENLGTLGVLKKWEGAIARRWGSQVSREVIKDFAKTMAYSALAEGNEEFLTSIAQDFTDGVTGVNPDWQEGLFGRALNAGLVGMTSGVALSTPGGVASGVNRQMEVKRAERAKAFYEALEKSAESTKLRERLPEAQRKLVEQITKNTDVENVYVPVDAFDTYFQSAKDDNGGEMNPVAVIQDLGVLEAYNEAKLAGLDVKIPLATWVDKFVGTGHYQGLANDVKFSPDGFTVNEAKIQLEIERQVAEQLKAQSEAATTSPQEASTDESAAQVGEIVAQQLEAAGVDPDSAQIYEAVFRTLGKRMGVDPLELFNRFGLTIGRGEQAVDPAQSSAQVMEQDTAPKERIDQAFNSPDAIDRYKALPGADGGKFIDADLARQLLPEYAASRDGAMVHSAATDEPAGRLAARVWEQMLAQPPSDQGAYAQILAGGSAAGKTYYREHYRAALDADIVFDTTSANYERTKERIQQALDSGRHVVFTYIYRDFNEALAANASRFNESGRLVAPDYMAYSHVNALENYLRLKQDFAGQPVDFEAFANTPEGLKELNVARIDNLRYNATVGTEFTDGRDQTQIQPGALGEVQSQGAGVPGAGAKNDRGAQPAGPESAVERLTRIASDRLRNEVDQVNAARKRAAGDSGPTTLNQSAVPQPQIQPPFYSKLERLVQAKMGNSATIEQVRALLKDVKEEERKWSGIDEFLKGKEKVSRAELLEFLRLNQLEIKEVTKGDVGQKVQVGATVYGVFSEDGEWQGSFLDEHNAKQEAKRLSREEGSEFTVDKAEWDGETTLEDVESTGDGNTKFSQYTLPGGENYREILFTLPSSNKPTLNAEERTRLDEYQAVIDRSTSEPKDILEPEELADFENLANRRHQKFEGDFRSSHFDEPNVLAHTRLNDRVDADGKRVLFVEEIQSDWHQEGRKKGYKGDELPAGMRVEVEPNKKLGEFRVVDKDGNLLAHGDTREAAIANVGGTGAGQVPDAPFRKTWHEFVLKRLIRMAAEQGYDRIAWTTGEQQAERYDLSKQIDEINYGKIKGDDSSVWIRIWDKNTNLIPLDSQGFEVYSRSDEENMHSYKVPKESLDDVVGKEIAQTILAGEGSKSNKGGRSLTDTGLKVGGEGMKGFYDKIVPDFLNKFAKKFGAKVGEINLESPIKKDGNGYSLNGFFYATLEDAKADQAEGQGGGVDPGKVHSLDITPQLKNAALYEGFSLFQPSEDGPRGQIQIGQGGINISILKTADASTFFHETGHFYLQVMETLASSADTPQQIKDDLAKIRQWVGAEEGQAFTVEQHEMFARGFEAYLMEGKAPSQELRSAFARFKVWLISVYRQLTSLNVQLTDDVRGVMDRLLATDEEISRVMQEQNVQPLFPNPESIGLTGEKLERYIKARDEARQAAEEQLTAKVMAEFQREKEAWWKKQRSRVRSEIEDQVNQQRIYRALSILQRGKMPDGSPLPDGMGELKLSKQILTEKYGKEFLKRLPRPYVYSAKDGLHPDIVAEFLGFESGDDLVTQIANAKKKDVLIDELADARMRELHPSLMDGPKFSEEALKAIHNEKRSELLRLEIEILNEIDPTTTKNITRLATRRPPTKKLVREKATQIVAQRKVGDLSPYLFQRAEAKAAKEAGERLAKGDIDGVIEAKNRELLNHELYRAATLAQEEVEKALEMFKLVLKSDEKIAKTREMDLVNAARAILADYGLGRTDQPSDSYLEQIRRYDPETYATMEALVGSVRDNAGPYKEVTFDNFLSMADTVRALWDLSRSTRQIEIDGQMMEREQLVEELKVAMDNMGGPGGKPPGYEKAVSNWEKAKLQLLGVRASLRRVESWVDAMDSGEISGAFRRYIWTPISEATSRYREAKKATLEKYLELVKKIEPTLSQADIKAPEIGYTFSGKQELLGALLHTGNESNLQKLLRGRNWGEFDDNNNLDTSRWDTFIRRMINEGVLTKADYDFVQGVWDLLEEMKPQAQKVHKKLYGYYFNEITAQEFQTPFGVYRGGYVPAVADPFIAQDAAIREEKAALEGLNNSFMFPTAGRGFTKKRTEFYAKPLSLDLRFVPSHIDKVMRFVHIEPHVKEVGRLVMDRVFREGLDRVDPAAGGDMLVPWLQRTALQKIETPMSGWGGKAADNFFRTLRTRTGLQIMAANVTNALQQFTGFSIAAVKVKPKYLRDALWSYVRGPKVMSDAVAEKSIYMRNELTASSHEIMAAVDDMLLNPNKYEKARDFAKQHGYFLQKGFQNVVNQVVWSAAYDQAVSQGLNELEAVRSADSAVRLTQGSFAAEDVSRFETGSPFVRAFTMFYSYFNMQSNLLGTEFQKVIRETGLKKGAGKLLYIYAFGFMIPAVMAEMIVRVMAGKPLDDDDDDSYLDDIFSIFFGSQVRAGSAMFPGVGPAVQAGINAFNDKWYDDRISTSPAVSMIESAVSAPKSVYNAITEDGSRKKAVRDTLSLLGLMTGMPLAPLARPLGYLSDVQEGNAEPTGPIDFTRGLITGKAGESR